MIATWTTKNGKKVEIETTPVSGASMVSMTLRIDGIQYSNVRQINYKGQPVIEFTENGKFGAPKMMISITSEIAATIAAERSESGKITDAQIATNKALDAYYASYRIVEEAMDEN